MDKDEAPKTNREKVREPQPGKCFWCSGCDANIVKEGVKCEVCGRVNGRKRAPKRDVR